MTRSQSNTDKKTKLYELDDMSDTSSQSNKENEHINCEPIINEVCSPKLKKIDKSKQLEQTLWNMGNKIMNYMEDTKPLTADNAFMEFIKIQFASVPEHEKNTRRKLIIDAISAPLP